MTDPASPRTRPTGDELAAMTDADFDAWVRAHSDTADPASPRTAESRRRHDTGGRNGCSPGTWDECAACNQPRTKAREHLFDVMKPYLPHGWLRDMGPGLAGLVAAIEDQAATEARRELDVDVLTEALHTLHMPMPWRWWAVSGGDTKGTSVEFAAAIAAEYRRLIEEGVTS